MASIVSAGTTSATALNMSADTTGILQLASNNGTVGLTMDTSQNVGIGTSSPSSYGKFTVNDTSYSSVYVRSSSTNFAGLLLDNTNSASKWQIGVEGGTYNTAGVLNIGISGVGTGLAIDTSRNVGIGTTAPIGKLQVAGGRTFLCANSETYALAVQYTSSTGQYYIGATNSATPDLVFSNVGGAERMRITSGGLVGVNTTNPAGGNGGQFTVNSSTSNAGQFIVTTSSYPLVASQNGSSSGLIYFNYNNGNVGNITTNGTVITYGGTSDYRLKNITGNLTGYKERLMSLLPKQGTWKSNNSEFRGFLAHEFAVNYSASVTGEKDAVDDEGNPVMQGMQASSAEVMADLIALVQEQQALITQLQADVAALKGAA